MLSYAENILQTLTGRSSLNDINEDELKRIAAQYPYFGSTQFLLARKLYLQKEDYKPALQKAAVHFRDAAWLNYNFFYDGVSIDETFPAIENISEAEIDSADAFDHGTENFVHVNEEVQTPELQTSDADILTEPFNTNSRIEEEANGVINTIEEYQTPEWQTEAIEVLDEPSVYDDNNTGNEVKPDEASNEKLSNLLKEQAAAFEKPVEETALPIEVAAHHRVDYFESQGIKLEEEKANDKLGTQMKRFTEWLKQMKRINPNLSNSETDTAAESQVQNMAEHSNKPKEVVTEAMAEVLIKQGKPEQAISIYEKLSFSNPSKSAYFAAKIQELKSINS